MTTKVNIFTEDWCNLVFEGKNKEYGAYVLRQESTKRHLIAILLSVSLFTIGVSAPTLIKTFIPEKKYIMTEVNNVSNIDQAKPEQITPPIEPPQPQLRRTLAFTPPVISNETDPTEEAPVVDAILNGNIAIGTKTQDGLDDPNLPVEFERALTEEKLTPRRFVSQMPEFMGGEDERIKFIQDNLVYPSIAAEMGISGRVTLEFIVASDGSISDVKVIRGIGGGCDEEAIRVAKLMPRWKPGKQNGKPVPVIFVMPISFALLNQ